MSSAQVDVAWLQGEVRDAVRSFVTQLRSIADGDTRVPNLNWTVGDLGAHIACLPALYRSQHEIGLGFVQPDDFDAFSAQARAHIDERNPTALAALIDQEISALVGELAREPSATRMLYGQSTTATNLMAGVLTELLLHGQDLADITGQKVTFTKQHALAAIPAMLTLAPAFVDTKAAAQTPGVIHLKFRGGDDWTFEVADGGLTVTPGKPDRPDAHINADPAAFVLNSMGRLSDLRAGLTGKFLAWGRRPWLLARLGKLRIDGV